MRLATTSPLADYPYAFTMLILAVGVVAAALAAAKFYAIQLRASGAVHDGLLLWHVVTIGSSVALTWIMLALGGLDILGIIQTPRWIRLIGYSASGVGTIVALILIALLNRRRVQRHSDEPTCPAVDAPADHPAGLEDGAR